MSGDGRVATEDTQRAAIRSLFQDLPGGFSERLSAVVKLRDIFHEEIALAMTAPLNEYFGGLAQDTAAEKTQTATHINGTLRSLGLTIREPKTQLPALLVTDVQASKKDTHEISRFRLEVRDENGQISRPLCARYLPELSFMQDRQRRDYWKKRQPPAREK
jgi:hypothetical protein